MQAIKINGIEVDPAKLISKDELLENLTNCGANDSELSDIRNSYFKSFGNELIWQYPISDGVHAGVTIVAVKEGFICLPYDVIEKSLYEIFELDEATMLDEDSIKYFIDNWKRYSDYLAGTMVDMLTAISGK